MPIKKTLFKIGDRVVCMIPVEAYYSGYAGNPLLIYPRKVIGTVVSIAAKVRILKGPGLDGRDEFLVVDYHCLVTHKVQRVGLNFCNAQKVR